MDEADFNKFVLASMPHFIAVNYQHLLETQNPQERVNLILHVYNLLLRTMTIILVSQYLSQDRSRVNDQFLNKLLLDKFPTYSMTLDMWQKILFACFNVYQGKAKLFFMPELYDFYWDSSMVPHRPHPNVEQAFERLTQVAVGIRAEKELPQDEAEWSTLEQEIMRLLKNTLSMLSFIAQYDLIRVLDYDGTFYRFELHKGLTIAFDRQPLPTAKLKRGYFYLRAETETFLDLHPLLMFWESELEREQLVPPDTGIYDRLIHDEQLQYLLSMSGKTIVDDNERIVKEFLLLLRVLEEIKRQRQETQEAEKLSWLQLTNTCIDITDHRMATVRGKFRKGLYLQRDKTHREFEHFLQSDKRCFVLIGKSGVGKSNFLLAVAEELRQSRSDVCVLMYDGANVSVEKSLTGVISQDFDQRIKFGQPMQHIWREIAKIDGIEQRLVLLCVDAINENPQAKELLRQINDLVQEPWPWLKVVFSSRPETWRSIKRGVKLAEALYYCEQEPNTLGVELEPFSYSERMEPFTHQELPQAYRKYQQKFKLETPYETLTHEVRETLREPLNLWLVANTYSKKTVPPTLKVTELVERYVSELLRSERLRQEDLRLLGKQLVPLMVGERRYRNEITGADIDAEDDERLYLAINSEQILRDGQRINQSFTNLLDTDILVQQRQGHEQKIAFKYERFYEYFVGKRIAQLSETQANQYAFFLDLIEATSTTPFLWGAVRNALAQVAKDRESETLLKLCFTDQQRVKEMLVNVLIYLGSDEQELVETLLKCLIPAEKKATELQKLRGVLGKTAEVSDLRTRNARKIAIEAASNLNLAWVLQTAALQTDPTVRAMAVRYSYYLWQRDREAGFEILEHVEKKATSGFIPNFMALESAMGLSFIIFFEYYRDAAVSRRLQNIWREMISKLLRIREGSSRWEGAVRALIQERLLSFTLTVVFRLLREFPDYNIVTYQNLEAFFHLGTTEKVLYRNLIQYLDVEGDYPKEQMENDYLEAIKIDNLFLVIVAIMGLIAHGDYAPLAFLPFLKRLFEEAKRDVETYPYLPHIAQVVDNILVHYPMMDDMFEFFVSIVEICQEYCAKYPQTLRSRTSQAPETTYLGPYVFHQYRRTGTVKTAWLETRIQAALSQNNVLFFDLLVTLELPLVAFERQTPKATLAVLELFFNSSNAEIRQMIMALLARMRIHYPDAVDDFLEEQQCPDDFRLQVRTNEPIERVGELIGQRGWYFLRDDMLMGPPELRSQLMRIFAKAADCKNTRTWVEYFIRHLVNLMYGSQVLRQSE